MKIGITGQAGFIGTHLYNYLNFVKKGFQLIPFEDDFYSDPDKLQNWVTQCDTIVHFAGMNRNSDPKVIYDTNVRLAVDLINALSKSGKKVHIIFSSSTQEEKDNPYGNSKRVARTLLSEWCEKNNSVFTGLIIPNVFGPFGNPYYNSVIATFCYQLTHNEEPVIENDSLVKLIYVSNLVEKISDLIIKKVNEPELKIDHQFELKVSDILLKIKEFKHSYFENNIIPNLKTDFDIVLFNTFRCFIDPDFYPVKLKLNQDNRGNLTEIIKTNTSGQMFYSSTKPGITRGNHFHTRKIERFCVINGQAVIKLRKAGTDKIIEYHVNGDEPTIVDMPVWHTHSITNTGKDDLLTLFWCNEFYNAEDTDTFFEQV